MTGRPDNGHWLRLVDSPEPVVTRTLVVADDPLYGEGLKVLLEEAGHRPVFRVDSVERAGRFCSADTEEHHHRVLWFVDVLDHETFGAGCALRQAHWTGICVVARSVGVELVEELVRERSGWFSVLLRTPTLDFAQIARVLEQLAEGTATLDRRILRRLTAGSHEDALANLNAMDQWILELMACGLRNGEIARHTRRSEKAVEKHVGRLFSKLGLDAGESAGLDRRVTAARLFYSTRRVPELHE